jgi:hypothetical protein
VVTWVSRAGTSYPFLPMASAPEAPLGSGVDCEDSEHRERGRHLQAGPPKPGTLEMLGHP